MNTSSNFEQSLSQCVSFLEERLRSSQIFKDSILLPTTSLYEYNGQYIFRPRHPGIQICEALLYSEPDGNDPIISSDNCIPPPFPTPEELEQRKFQKRPFGRKQRRRAKGQTIALELFY